MKCAGTYVEGVFGAMGAQDAVASFPKFLLSREKYQLCDPEQHFTIGLIRDVWSWYVSMWSYGTLTRMKSLPARLFLGKEEQDMYGRGKDSLAAFRMWLQRMTSGEFGMYSHLLAFHYTGGRHNYFSEKDIHFDSSPWYNGARDAEAINQLSWGSASCWVRSPEHVAVDLRRCLERFEALGGEVPWDAFNRSTVSTDAHAREHAFKTTADYYDDEMIGWVQAKDKAIIAKFGFDTAPTPTS